MSRKSLDSRVLKFKIPTDTENSLDYIPYCDFQQHKGIILRESVCLRRECQNYRMLYIGSIGRLNGDSQKDSS